MTEDRHDALRRRRIELKARADREFWAGVRKDLRENTYVYSLAHQMQHDSVY
jgi:hypothetical protein